MKKRFLLTSFDIWLPHHQSNSSDDLLSSISQANSQGYDLNFLRKLPVDVSLASSQVIEKIKKVKPDGVICCGMAEKRLLLSVEKTACCQESVLHTSLDLDELVRGAVSTEISYDCGKFVCEGLYYSVLDYISTAQLPSFCIFVHVPILTGENRENIIADFQLIIQKLALS